MSAVAVTRALLLAGVAAVAVGCSDSSSAPSTSSSVDLSAVLAQMNLASTFTVAGAGASATTPLDLSIPSPNPSSCTYSSATQGFICPTVNKNGVSFDLAYYLYDAAGHALTTPNAGPIASVRVVTDTKGTATIPPSNGTSGSVALTDHNDLTLSGLQSDKRTLNGTTTSGHDVQLLGATTVHAVVEGSSATHDVVLPNEGSTSAWPLSGTITSDFTTSLNRPEPLANTSTHSVLTFNGASTATLVMTTTSSAGSATTTCTIDLTGAKTPVCL